MSLLLRFGASKTVHIFAQFQAQYIDGLRWSERLKSEIISIICFKHEGLQITAGQKFSSSALCQSHFSSIKKVGLS